MNLPAYWKRDIFFIVLFSLFFLLSTGYFRLNNLTFRMDSDYDMLFSYYSYVSTFVQSHLMIPRIHHLAGLRLPLAGDPGISFYNPFFLIPIALFGMIPGTYVILFLMYLLSGLSMWWFLKSFAIDRTIRLWGSLLYLSSGALSARFAAGHVIFFLTYPFWPLVFSALTNMHQDFQGVNNNSLPFVRGGLGRGRSRYTLSALLGFLTACFFLSGDIYGVWFIAIFYATTLLYLLTFSNPETRVPKLELIKNAGITTAFFLLVSSPKLYFLVKDALPVFDRTFTGNPAESSIHLWWTLLPFIIPFKVSFYDRPFFQHTLGFYFNWYEYYAFLSPLPFLFFIPLVHSHNHSTPFSSLTSHSSFYVKLLLLYIFVGLFYIALAFPYSPFYWLFNWIPQLHIFRVPQRMYLPLSSLLIALFALAAQRWKQHYLQPSIRILFHIILWGSVLWTVVTSIDALRLAFETPRLEEKTTIAWLKHEDTSSYFVANFLCCNQTFLIEAGIPVINFYSGWTPKGTPVFTDTTGEHLDLQKLQTTRPRYILSPPTMDLTPYTYKKIYEKGNQTIWKTEEETLHPKQKGSEL